MMPENLIYPIVIIFRRLDVPHSAFRSALQTATVRDTVIGVLIRHRNRGV
jgi:hypothetical protein